LQVGSKATLAFEAGTEFGACEKIFDPRGDAAGDVNASPRGKCQRHIAGDRPEHRAKQLKGHPRNAAAPVQPRHDDFGGVALRRLRSVHCHDRAVKIFQTEA
jgi:hypothetical protein